MVSHASLFSQLIALFDRGIFHNLVYQHKANSFLKDLTAGIIRCHVILPISPSQKPS